MADFLRLCEKQASRQTIASALQLIRHTNGLRENSLAVPKVWQSAPKTRRTATN